MKRQRRNHNIQTTNGSIPTTTITTITTITTTTIQRLQRPITTANKHNNQSQGPTTTLQRLVKTTNPTTCHNNHPNNILLPVTVTLNTWAGSLLHLYSPASLNLAFLIINIPLCCLILWLLLLLLLFILSA